MKANTRKLVGIGLFTAIVVVLQMVFGNVTIGGTPINPVLVPVVVGAAIYGWKAGAWLGFVSGMAILLTGAAAFFMAFDVAGTIITVLVKGTASGLAAGLVYRLLSRKSNLLAVFVAAAVCPLVNTCIFIIGCFVFFLPNLTEMAAGANVFGFIMTAFVGINILVELGLNMILAPTITRLIRLGKK